MGVWEVAKGDGTPYLIMVLAPTVRSLDGEEAHGVTEAAVFHHCLPTPSAFILRDESIETWSCFG